MRAAGDGTLRPQSKVDRHHDCQRPEPEALLPIGGVGHVSLQQCRCHHPRHDQHDDDEQEDDTVVNFGYSFDMAVVLQENGKEYELYTYEGGGHNLISPDFSRQYFER